MSEALKQDQREKVEAFEDVLEDAIALLERVEKAADRALRGQPESEYLALAEDRALAALRFAVEASDCLAYVTAVPFED